MTLTSEKPWTRPSWPTSGITAFIVHEGRRGSNPAPVTAQPALLLKRGSRPTDTPMACLDATCALGPRVRWAFYTIQMRWTDSIVTRLIAWLCLGGLLLSSGYSVLEYDHAMK